MKDYEALPRLQPEVHIGAARHVAVNRRNIDSFPLHWHNYFEIEIILSGRGRHLLNGTEYGLERGDCYLLTPVDFHEVQVLEPVELINISFDETCLSEHVLQMLTAVPRRLRMAADNGNSLSAYLIYKAYRDRKFDEKPSEMMKYLRMAADMHFGFAEYEYAKYLKDKSPEDAKEYFKRAAEHGCEQANYAYGKMLFEEGNREEAREWLERSTADEDAWTQMRVGLLLYYEYEDYDAGWEYMRKAADQGYEPAKEAIRAINNNLNAQIVIGVCDLFHYASNIIDDRAEDMYAKEHQVNYHGIDKKQRREIRAKKQAQGHSLTW